MRPVRLCNRFYFSKEIQDVDEEIVNTVKKDYEILKSHSGDDYWYYMVNIYSVYPEWIESVDKKYGNGASKFIGEALKFYSDNSEL